MSKKEDSLGTGFWIGLVIALAVVGAIAFGLTWAFGMHTVAADNGEEVVLVDKPFFWGHKGVRDYVLKTGDRQLEWYSTTAIPVVITPVSLNMPFENLSTKDGTFLDFDTSITVTVTDSKNLIGTKGAAWFENSLQKPWIATFRNLVKLYTVDQLLQDPAIMPLIEDQLLATLNDRAREDKLAIKISDFNMGQGKPNKVVVNQMDESAREVQAATTHAKAKIAQEARKAAEVARGEADSAYAAKMGYSPEQVVQMAAINAYSEACKQEGAKCVIMAPGANPVIGLGK